LSTLDPSGLSVNRVGQVGPIISVATGGVPKWQGTLAINYATGRLNVGAQWRYVSSGVRDLTLIGPDDPRYSPTLPNSINRNHVRAYTYMNLNASYAIVDNDRRKVEIFGVINNVFDQDPPSYLPFFWPTNPVLYDTLGRSYRGGVRLAF
jgi:outer membrane receptor for ferrienterochelin and colicin